MKKIILLLGFCLSLLLFDIKATQAQSKSLFNGKDLKGWHADVPEMDKNTNARMPFIVRDGMLVSLGTPGGHLITDATYQNYRIEIEYRFAGTPGNCGALVLSLIHI